MLAELALKINTFGQKAINESGEHLSSLHKLKQPSTPFLNLKMAMYCPQGSGTLRQQLLMMHGIAWNCMVLHGIALYCMVLHGIAW